MDILSPIRAAGLIAMTLNLYGFWCTNSKQSKLYFCAGSLAWAAQSLLLGSLSGMAVVLVTAVRQGTSAFVENQSKLTKIQLSLAFTTLAVICYIATTPFDEYFRLAALVPLVATIFGTWTLFVMNNLQMRYSLYLVNLSWLAYGWQIHSWELVATSVIACALNYVSIKKIKAIRLKPATKLDLAKL